MMAQKGYVVVSFDSRGTPAPKGRAWRKTAYKKIGITANNDQAANHGRCAHFHTPLVCYIIIPRESRLDYAGLTEMSSPPMATGGRGQGAARALGLPRPGARRHLGLVRRGRARHPPCGPSSNCAEAEHLVSAEIS